MPMALLMVTPASLVPSEPVALLPIVSPVSLPEKVTFCSVKIDVKSLPEGAMVTVPAVLRVVAAARLTELPVRVMLLVLPVMPPPLPRAPLRFRPPLALLAFTPVKLIAPLAAKALKLPALKPK